MVGLQGIFSSEREQALDNLEVALAAAGAELDDIVKWTIYLVAREGQDASAFGQAFGVAMQRIGALETPPAISVVHVAGLAHPEFLIEIEALAAVKP